MTNLLTRVVFSADLLPARTIVGTTSQVIKSQLLNGPDKSLYNTRFVLGAVEIYPRLFWTAETDGEPTVPPVVDLALQVRNAPPKADGYSLISAGAWEFAQDHRTIAYCPGVSRDGRLTGTYGISSTLPYPLFTAEQPCQLYLCAQFYNLEPIGGITFTTLTAAVDLMLRYEVMTK